MLLESLVVAVDPAKGHSRIDVLVLLSSASVNL